MKEYPTLISQELWEQCQKQKALNNHNGAGLKYSQKPFVLRGLITCGRTGRVCPCEDQLRRKYYSWVVCYTKTGQRRYIPEQDVLSAIETVLNRIKVPDSLINPLYEDIKNAEILEKQYCQQEIGKLRQESLPFTDCPVLFLAGFYFIYHCINLEISHKNVHIPKG